MVHILYNLGPFIFHNTHLSSLHCHMDFQRNRQCWLHIILLRTQQDIHIDRQYIHPGHIQ